MHLLRAIPIMAVVLAGAAELAPAHAGSLSTTQLATAAGVLDGFNAVSFGAYTQNSETEGSALIGGNLAGDKSGDFCFQNCTLNPTVNGTGYASLTVFGSLSGTNGTGAHGANIAIGNAAGGVLGAATSTTAIAENGYGGLSVAGKVSGLIDNATSLKATGASGSYQLQNMGSAPQTYGLATAAAFPYGSSIAPVQTALTALAGSVDALNQRLIAAGKGETLTPQMNTPFKPTANYVGAGGQTYAILSISATSLENAQNWPGINGTGLDAVIVVVDATGTVNLPMLNASAGDSNVLWDLVNATTVTTDAGWAGTTLAPDASFHNNGIVDGTVVAAAITQSAEIHNDIAWNGSLAGLPTSSGHTSGGLPVPEPGTLGVFGLAAAALSLARRGTARHAAPASQGWRAARHRWWRDRA